MDHVTLNNGVRMPVLGFGVFQVADPAVCEQTVLEAIDTGYRLIDTAAIYGNESAVGVAIRKCAVPREELFITTKLWVSDAGYEKTKAAVAKSLKNLQTEYLDLYLIHRPFGDYYGSWRAMEELYKEGTIRAIGLSNFGCDRLIDLCMNQEVVPAVNQVEIHPFFQQDEALKIMREYKIQPEAWAPFAEGHGNLFENKILSAIGRKYGKSAAQVILRWNYQRGIVTIPKTVHRERMEQNIGIFDFELSGEDLETLKMFDKGATLFRKNEDPDYARMINSIKI